MANVTLAIAEELLQRARIRAVREGTSVNAVVRDYLTVYAGGPSQREVLEEVDRIADRAQAGSGSEGRNWRREDLYER